jgi:predicted DNA-binding transcriptional regulator AlpA
MRFKVENETYITLDEVEKLVDLKLTSIYTRYTFGDFPKPINFEIRQAWKESDIEEYLEKSRKHK